MKEIPLTRGKVALVDDADFDFLSQFKWYAHANQNGDWYAARSAWPVKKCIMMHRVLLDAQPGQFVDHANMNGLDNQRSNIRICTAQENRRNTKKYKGSKQVYKGARELRPGQFHAYIKFNGKQIHIGAFGTLVDAARAYDSRARELFGEFARTNFGVEDK